MIDRNVDLISNVPDEHFQILPDSGTWFSWENNISYLNGALLNCNQI